MYEIMFEILMILIIFIIITSNKKSINIKTTSGKKPDIYPAPQKRKL
jgi:hypothetical protein